MDILYALVKTLGFVLSLGVLAIVPVLFILALMKRVPWMLAAPAMAVVAFVAAYPAGMLEGMKKERVSWEIRMHNLQAALEVKKRQAEKAGAVIEAKYLMVEAEKEQLRQSRDDDLKRLMDDTALIIENSESKIHENTCHPYSMRVSPDILRNIKGR